MSPLKENELQQLIELLLEERISDDLLAQLNTMLLHEESRDFYVNYMLLHGMLGWDAGLNCPLSKQPPEFLHELGKSSLPEVHRSHQNKNAYYKWTLISACLAIFLSAGIYYSGIFRNQHVAENNPAPQTQFKDVLKNPSPQDKLQQNQITGDPKQKFPPLKITPHEPDSQKNSADGPVMDPTPGHIAGQDITIPPDIRKQDYSDQSMINMINYELSKSWHDTGVTASPVADDHEWIRRVYLDLAGRIPSSQETARILSKQSRFDRSELVRHLLQSEDFSRQFSTEWATLLVGRSHEKRSERTAVRKYLTQSMNDHFTWSRIFQDLLTAEGSLEENGATGFLLAHLNDMAVPATAVTCRLLLGEQLQCVQCHKHPHNNWTQDYFWEINSFFKQTKAVSSTVNNKQVTRLVSEKQGGPTYYETVSGLMKVSYPKLGDSKVDPGAEVNRRMEFSRLLLTQKNKDVSRAFVNRTWAMLFGYGFTNPIDDIGPHNPASHPALFDKLSEGFVASGYDIRRLITWITLSDAYQRTSKLGDENSLDQPEKGETPLFSRVYLKMMSPEQLYLSLQVLLAEKQRIFPDQSQQEAWTEQFVIFAQNDENGEFNQFYGTVNQALELMNGDKMNDVIKRSCSNIITRFPAKNKWTEAQCKELLKTLSLTFMTREPTARETVLFLKLLDQKTGSSNKFSAVTDPLMLSTMEDMAWVMLNSSEFVLVH